jgi:hypothetical protein
MLAGCLAVNATETWIFPHYVAPEAPLIWICVMESLVTLSARRPKWGRALVVASIVSCVAANPGLIASSVIRHVRHDDSWARTAMAEQLAAHRDGRTTGRAPRWPNNWPRFPEGTWRS